ncbi:MAG TPA: CoA-binding protein [Puia sp.]|jgi:predicted CoA-binding protein|nr:CoA-binding protein [Puia sp.]
MPSTSKKTLVLGASANPARYSFLAINKLREHDHHVIAIGKRPALVADVPVQEKTAQIDNLDTVSIYLNKNNQKNYYDYIISQHPRRVIFNPGAENPEFEMILADKGIKALEACTLVLLATGQY